MNIIRIVLLRRKVLIKIYIGTNQISKAIIMPLICCQIKQNNFFNDEFNYILEMSKQKTQKSLFHHTKSSGRGSHSYPWSEKHFSELYPLAPILPASPAYFNVIINYQSAQIKVRLPQGIQTAHLQYLFHLEIYRYLLEKRDSNPLFKTALVVGFQSTHGDLLLDYRISIGEGTLEPQKLAFNCLEFVNQGRLKRYQICKCLAIGGFSKVYLVRSLRDGQFYAMKVMLKQFICQNQKQSIVQNERDICMQLNHPFVVKLNHCFETHHFVCFLFQYCPGGELFYYLKSVRRMSEEDARFYFIQILYGLMYLHQQNIIYRDLKPQNLLINHDGHVKIADFGLSKAGLATRQVTYSFCGSTQYMPPEMIQKTGHSYGVDFYTLGALLYELVTGLPPFYSRNQEEIKDAIINEELTFPDHVSLTPEIKNLLGGLLNKNPKLRLGSMKGLKQVLFHPWIGRINSENVLSKKMVPPYVPTYEQFNFDQNELGQDEQEFTGALSQEHLIPASAQRLIYKNFEFINDSTIRGEVKEIYQKYAQKKQKHLKSSSSTKSLKKSHSKDSIRRQSSIPFSTTSNIPLNRSASPKKSKTKKVTSIDFFETDMKKFSSTCGSFGSLKKASVSNMNKSKENNNSGFLKKKKQKNMFLK